jgi:hypothetical protein
MALMSEKAFAGGCMPRERLPARAGPFTQQEIKNRVARNAPKADMLFVLMPFSHRWM